MIAFDNVTIAENFVNDEIIKYAATTSDHRFAVVYGQHFDLTEYVCRDQIYGDYFAVVTRYDATDCENITHASHEHMKKVNAIAVFTELTDAIDFFMSEIYAILIQPRSM